MLSTLASAPAAFRVRVWAIMSPRPRGGRAPPEGANVAYPPKLIRRTLKEGVMASLEKSKDDQKSQSSGLTRRQFLPLLGATAVAAATPGVLSAAPGGSPDDHLPRRRNSSTWEPTQLPAFPRRNSSEHCRWHLCFPVGPERWWADPVADRSRVEPVVRCPSSHTGVPLLRQRRYCGARECVCHQPE